MTNTFFRIDLQFRMTEGISGALQIVVSSQLKICY